MQDLDTRLHYLLSGVYESSNLISKEFIDKLLDDVMYEYGELRGSKVIFDIIQNRLEKRIGSRNISDIKDFVQGDMLLIEEAINKGFNIDRKIDLEQLKERELHTISETLDEYYNSIYTKANKEAFNLNFYLQQQKEHLIASGGPSLLNNEQKLADMSNDFNKQVEQALSVSNTNSKDNILLKDEIEIIKQKINNEKELTKEEEKFVEQKIEQKQEEKAIVSNKERPVEKKEESVEYSSNAQNLETLLKQYKMKDSENANNVGVDFEKLRMDIVDEILQNKEDKSVAMAIAKNDPSFIGYVSMELQYDLDIAREIIKNNPETASQYLNEQFVNYIKEKEAKEKEQKNEPQDNTIRMSRNAESISSLISEYKSKEARRFSSGAASISFDNLGDSIEREIRKNSNDKSVAIAIAKSDPYFIKYVSEELKSDMDVVREIVRNNPKNASKYVNEELVEKIKKEEEQKKLEFEKQKGQLDSNSPLVDAVKNSYEQDKGMGL